MEKSELENSKERVTQEDIRKLFPELSLSPNILSLFDGNCTDEIIKRYFIDKEYTAPNAILDLNKIQQDHYLTDRYKPILAHSHSGIFAFDTQSKGYAFYYIESNIEALKESLTWDGIFINEILRWWEREISDEHILYIGNFFGLQYTNEILESIYNSTNGEGFATLQEIEQWEIEMLDMINAKNND